MLPIKRIPHPLFTLILALTLLPALQPPSMAFARSSDSLIASLDSENNLVINETGGDTWDELLMRFDETHITLTLSSSGTLGISGISAADGDGTDTLHIPFAAVTGSRINLYTGGGDDTLTVDFSSGGSPLPIHYDGGDQVTATGDVLHLPGGMGDPIYAFVDAHSGSVEVPGSGKIIYTDLEPISSSITATNVTLNYGTTGETITITDAGGGQTTVSSTAGESTTFNNPTGTLTINPGDTNANYIRINALTNPYPANIVINGGNAGDTVDFVGAITFAADKSLSVDAKIIKLWNAAADIATSGTGGITLTATQKIQMITGSSLSTVDGGITLDANSGGTSSGNFKGIDIQTASLQTTGMGAISLTGIGGDTGTNNYGVHLRGSTSVSSTAIGAAAGAIILDGTGGNGDAGNYGLILSGSTVTSVDGEISLTGQGSTVSTGDGNRGIVSDGSSQVTATGSAGITANGAGGGAGSSRFNYGVQLLPGGIWQVAGGTLHVSGRNSAGNSFGIFLNGGGLLSSGTGAINLVGDGNRDLFIQNAASEIGGSSATGDITLNANTIDFSAGTIDTAGSLTIQPRTAGTTIGLGGGSGTLNLDDGKISRLADGFSSITIGNATAGNIDIQTVSFLDPLNLVTGGEVHDRTGTDITMVNADTVTVNGTEAPGQSPGILEVNGNFAFADNSTFEVEIGGTTPGTGNGNHDQLLVSGAVTIGNTVTLDTVAWMGFVPAVGDEFVIIDNDGTDAVTGTFSGLAEGVAIPDFLGSGQPAQISYVGGDGNDVVLTVNKADQTITFGALADKTYGDADFSLSASTSSGLAVSFASSTPGVCTVSGTTVSLVAAGSCSITASQAGNANYNAAPDVVRSFTVNKAGQTPLMVSASPANIHYGETSTLSTSGGSGSGTVTYAVTSGGGFCSISGATLTGIGVGTCTVTATKAADGNYNAANATVEVMVAPIVTITGTPPGGSDPVQVDLSGGGNTCGFTSWQFEAPVNPPARIGFPYGVLAFVVAPCTQHGTVTLTFTYPVPLPKGTRFWNFGPTAADPTPHWYTLPATVSGNQLIVQITDGEPGDNDLTRNGSITALGGAGVPLAASVPALPLWGLALLAILLGGAGWRAGARRCW